MEKNYKVEHYDNGEYEHIYPNGEFIKFNNNDLKVSSKLNGSYQEYYVIKGNNIIKEDSQFFEDLYIITNFDFDGYKTSILTFRKGKFDGKQYYYYSKTGNIKSEVEYKDGLSNGMHYIYYENGKLMREILNKDGKWVYIKTFNQDGILFSIQDEKGFHKYS